jgi:LPS-assembly lipoprotein
MTRLRPILTTWKRRVAECAGVAAVAVFLAACGFSPLYGEHGTASSPGVTDALASVIIRPLPDRQGMKLRQALREQLQPGGLSASPAYELAITLTTTVEELGIRKDATSSRANLFLAASFYLIEGGERVFGDRVQAVVSYNILDDQYATVASQADAENRAIRQVSEEIKTRLAVYIHRRLNPGQAASASR